MELNKTESFDPGTSTKRRRQLKNFVFDFGLLAVATRNIKQRLCQKIKKTFHLFFNYMFYILFLLISNSKNQVYAAILCHHPICKTDIYRQFLARYFAQIAVLWASSPANFRLVGDSWHS